MALLPPERKLACMERGRQVCMERGTSLVSTAKAKMVPASLAIQIQVSEYGVAAKRGRAGSSYQVQARD